MVGNAVARSRCSPGSSSSRKRQPTTPQSPIELNEKSRGGVDTLGYLGPCQPSIGLAPSRSFHSPSDLRSSMSAWTMVLTLPQPHLLMQPGCHIGSHVVEPTSTCMRGDVAFRPERYGHRLMESIGGSPAAAAEWSTGSAPASAANVAYTSHTAVRPPSLRPCIEDGTIPPEAHAFTRMPPCQFDALPPLSGWLLAPPAPPK
mmetsp:Transcript_17446/g.35228  ORF Transcript_17446/g.35228 Transcript_17446/m.35228 type:complete len:202 (+) Transcript_17446:379-984(+)